MLISFRVLEARPQALALKRELEALGVRTFCSEVDIPPGADWWVRGTYRCQNVYQSVVPCT